MLKTITLMAVATLGFNLQTAHAQQQCGDRGQVIELLSDRYSEQREALGVTNRGALIEVLTNEQKGTWTIIVTSPKGVSCLMAAGDGWKRTDPELQKVEKSTDLVPPA
ncbi:hypothetical protein [Kiloniella sp. b19]|uniref:hypothetical protein n=1 Tax=Kiloniella sp. GXU_MW_B19 TaxID=3141326 RepID=UPI0031D1EECA